ncbi:hypothetical protein C8R43DRAFT_1042538 [Mycena crocata]|nr:hypothetical protein C8R43DRAFT_1042538 [Mycena crocata]
MSPDDVLPKRNQKLQGSCDICRRQKVRCDSATMPGNRCSKCIAFNSACTHNMSQSNKAGKGTRRKRVKSASEISADLDTARSLVNGILSGTYKTPEDHEALVDLLLQVSRYARSLEQHQSRSPSVPASGTSPSSDGRDGDTADADAGIVVNLDTLPEHLKGVTADTAEHRYFGENASVVFIGAAIEERQKHTVVPRGPRSKRTQFWIPLPWEASDPRFEPPVIQIFPADDLLRDLVDIYFTQLNIFFFVLHRPTFERALADGVHFSDHRFGSVVLAVCALASKNSDDERVLLPGEGELSAGWKWFRQIPRPFSGTLATASLYDLQLCCLYIFFLQLGVNLESCWLLCGIGILHAQDIGAHRRNRQQLRKAEQSWTVEAELSTRVCYYLSMFDAMTSSCFDRPRAGTSLHSELDFPALCDDEYFEDPDPARAFRQPEGRPSLAAYNLAYIRLMNIYSSPRKTGDPASIAQIDSRLDQWATEIPEHLLWNPYMEDDVFFAQSASLYTQYYHVQILLHRSLLQTPNNAARSPSAFKSLAICANAARSCAHVADVRSHRGFLNRTQNLKAVFDAAVVLVLNISGGARSGLSIDMNRELVAVYQCMGLLRVSERRWQTAGRYYDMLCELIHASDLPLPEASSAPEVPVVTGAASSQQWPDHLMSLPMAVDELGNLPVYDSLAQMDNTLLPVAPILSQSSTEFIVPRIPGPAGNLEEYPSTNVASQGHAYAAFANFNDVDMDAYMSEWIPYWSGASTLVQAMGNTNVYPR